MVYIVCERSLRTGTREVKVITIVKVYKTNTTHRAIASSVTNVRIVQLFEVGLQPYKRHLHQYTVNRLKK